MERQTEIKRVQNSGREMARVYSGEGLAPTIRVPSGGWHQPNVVLSKVGKGQDYKIHENECSTLRGMARHNNVPMVIQPILTPDRVKKRQHGRRMKENGEPMFTLTKQDIHGVSTGTRIRRLTPIECERLQGFSDNWTKFGIDSGKIVAISDTQRYKMMGNAVTVNVIEAIGRKMLFTFLPRGK